MRDTLNEQIQEFSARDFAGWLEGGIQTYLGGSRLPSKMRMADVFQFAELYIGKNQDDIAADIHDIYLDLQPRAQIAFRAGLALLWSELEFREKRTFALAETLLVIACRLSAKNMTDVLAGAIPWLAIAVRQFDEPARRLRRKAFQAAVELATGTTGSILCLERFLRERAVGDDVLETGQALTIIRYLALTAPQHLIYWCAIFGDYVVADARKSGADPSSIRNDIVEAYGAEDFGRVIDSVRIDNVNRLATEQYALTQKSLMGLYNLVSLVDSPAAQPLEGDNIVIAYFRQPNDRPPIPDKPSIQSQASDDDKVVKLLKRDKRELRGRN